jgi:dihydroneopterin aldolase
VVVPGGGPFADTVRREQIRIGYDDGAAHRMALLGMAQFGLALASLSATLVSASGVAAIRRALAENTVPVWLPLDLLEGSPDVPESWDMTSDSLAARLGGKLGAKRLIFLKRAPPKSLLLSELAAAGVVDPLVPRFVAGTGMAVWVCGPRDIPQIGRAIAEGGDVGERVEIV